MRTVSCLTSEDAEACRLSSGAVRWASAAAGAAVCAKLGWATAKARVAQQAAAIRVSENAKGRCMWKPVREMTGEDPGGPGPGAGPRFEEAGLPG